jgi:acyl carrier protein
MNRPQVERSANPRTQVFEALRAVLELADPDEQANFFEVGGSSLKAVLLCARLQEWWGIKIPAHLVFLNPILADLANVLSRYAKSAG